jgi:hypothetical protein
MSITKSQKIHYLLTLLFLAALFLPAIELSLR